MITTKQIDCRESTRRAFADISALLMSRYGIVVSFDDAFEMAKIIDREIVGCIRTSSGMTPDELNKELALIPIIHDPTDD